MQCSYCKGKDFENSTYNYYVCKNCGRLHYEDKKGGKKAGPASELYFAIGAGAVVLLMAILILLFATALSKRGSVRTAGENIPVSADKK